MRPLPLQPGHGPQGFEHGFSIFPFLGTFLLLVLLAGLLFYLWRQGTLALPQQLNRQGSPEDVAKGILAERFARGDISSDEFMERASLLNWTPGSDQLQSRTHRRH